MPQKLLVYTPKITNRIRYIFDFLFKEMMGLKVVFTSQADEFKQTTSAKLNYSSRRLSDKELFFYASPFLFERRTKPQHIKVEWYEGVPIFFINRNNSDLPFDPFAASFYLLSRYEEYLPDVKLDQHGRYMPENSLAYQHGFLQKPVVDIWAQQLAKVLLRYFPELPLDFRPYWFMPTYDIDIAYSYSHKGVLRTVAGWLKALYKQDKAELRQRWAVLRQKEKDPYDTYEWQYELQKNYQLQPIYFFPASNYGIYDKNVLIDKPALQSLIQFISDVCPIGIHPSYESHKDPQILAIEIRRLSEVIKKEVIRSRQHYLKMTIPNTYQNLIELDIKEDYTMGYASQIGFRAGTCSSFYFYDLTWEIRSTLRIFPFALMDVTLNNYLHLSPEQALEQVQNLIQEVKTVNGLFCTIWHNHSLCDEGEWQGWRSMYEQIIQMAAHAKHTELKAPYRYGL